MSIKHVLLGFLTIHPATGYDLRKMIEDSPVMHWSGNNNQIYKSLLELQTEGLISGVTEHRDALPVRRVYTATEDGLNALRAWVVSEPGLPDIRKPFLIQLGWADLLEPNQLNALIEQYEEEVLGRLMFHSEKSKRAEYPAARTKREIFLWKNIYENPIAAYKAEYEWIQKLKSGLYALSSRNASGESAHMPDISLISVDDWNYVECVTSAAPLSTEQDALDLVAACGEHDTYRLLLHSETLSADFFQIRTGVAGRMIQKFVNYHVKTALLISPQDEIKGRFAEMTAESAKGNHFRLFDSRKAAEEWLA